MVNSCVAYNCTERSNSRTTTSFHRFPMKNPKLEKLWIQAIRRIDWKPKSHSRICSKHFSEDDFFEMKTLLGGRILKPNAVPHIFDFPARLRKSLNAGNSSDSGEKSQRKNYCYKENLTLVSEETPIPSKVPRLLKNNTVLFDKTSSWQPLACAQRTCTPDSPVSDNAEKSVSPGNVEGYIEVGEKSQPVLRTPHNFAETLENYIADTNKT